MFISGMRTTHSRQACDGATPNGAARSAQESDQDSRRAGGARLIQIRHDLGSKDANRRSACLAEIKNTGLRETTVLRVCFESNDAESERVATMPVDAWGRTRRSFFSQTKNETKLAGCRYN